MTEDESETPRWVWRSNFRVVRFDSSPSQLEALDGDNPKSGVSVRLILGTCG